MNCIAIPGPWAWILGCSTKEFLFFLKKIGFQTSLISFYRTGRFGTKSAGSVQKSLFVVELSGSITELNGWAPNWPFPVLNLEQDWFGDQTSQTGWFRSGSDNTALYVYLYNYLLLSCPHTQLLRNWLGINFKNVNAYQQSK